MKKFLLLFILTYTLTASTIKELQQAIFSAPTPAERFVLTSILAERYDKELRVKRYRQTKAQNQTRIKETRKLYLQSLDPLSKTIKLSEHKELLKFSPVKNNYVEELRPTLYDLLAHRALEYFSKSYSTGCSYQEFSNKQKLYSPQDKNSCHYISLKIYNKLIALHQQEHNSKALLLVEIERLDYLYQKSHLETKDKEYVNALKKLEQEMPNSRASLKLATFYQKEKNYLKALNYANKGLKSSDDYVRLSSQYLIDEIKAKELGVEIESVNLPHENILTKVSYRNVDKLYVKVIKVNDEIIKTIDSLKNKEERFEYLKTLSNLKKLNFNLKTTSDYKSHSTELSLGSYELGRYLLVLSASKDFESKNIYQLLSVSNLSYVNKNDEKILILHRKTGQPLSDVKATLYVEEYNDKNADENAEPIGYQLDLISNQEGYITFPKAKAGQFTLRLEKDGDVLDVRANNNFYISDYETTESKTDDKKEEKLNRSNSKVLFYTDRAIYRPLQTIHFKGIVVRKFRNKAPQPITQRAVTVYLYSANRKKIAKKTLYTDEFGSFFGSFELPARGKMGSYSLRSSLGGNKAFRVEEYKRPKFTFTFNPTEKSYKLGDTVTLKGVTKAYMGTPIANAKVRYSVTRTTLSSKTGAGYRRKRIESGEGTTNKQGEFSLSFKALREKESQKSKKTIYSYITNITITDSTGESHSFTQTMILSDINFRIKLLGKNSFYKDGNESIAIESLGINGKFKALSAEIKIEKYQKDTKLYRERLWWSEVDNPFYSKEEFEKLFPNYRYDEKQKEKKERLQNYTIETAQQKKISLQGLEQGVYLISLRVDDVTVSKKITIQDPTKNEPPMTTALWHYSDKASYAKNEPVELTLQSSLPTSTPMLFSVTQDYKTVYSKWITLGQKNQSIKEFIDLQQLHQGRFFYHLLFVHNNRFYKYDGKVNIPWDDKLNLELITFRDKLKPNQKEQIKLKISSRDKSHPLSQMVATIYDASLDSFVIHNFKTPSLYHTQRYSYYYWYPKTFNSSSFYWRWEKKHSKLYQEFPILKGSKAYFSSKDEKDYALYNTLPIMHITNNDINNIPKDGCGGDINPVTVFEQEPVLLNGIRKKLTENILFIPNITSSDAEGNMVVDFKTNGALTKWNFLGFVHTKDFKTAVIKKSFVTQKELMVVSNLPRFFREKESITLTHKIVNMQNKPVQGECEMKLVNPITHKPIFTQPFKKHFNIDKNGSTTISFSFTLPKDENLSALEHTFMAKTSIHTDAEQMLIPILSNRRVITESKLLRVHAKERKHFSFDALKNNHSKTLKNHRLTLEFSANPAWYAIRSLPYLMEYEHECSEQLFARFSANALASHIINKTPKIRSIFKKWKNKKVLKSALNSNTKLKSVLLEETPWVVEAKSQEEELQRLGLLFDIDKMAEEQEKAEKQLAQRQLKNGGFSWFGSRYTNWYITQYIVEGMGHLEQKGIKIKNQKMLHRAIDALDKQIALQYKKNKPLTSMILHYLYARSFFTHFPMSKTIETAYSHYLKEAQLHWQEFPLYEQAMSAMALHYNGKDAQNIVRSLKKEAIVDEELGMYFPYPNGYQWNQLPIETHTLMIEVFKDIAHDEKSVKLLKLWLLQNRKSNHWRSTKSTTSAIYALLDDEELLTDSNEVKVEFDNQASPQRVSTDETGYFKMEFNDFNSSIADFTVTNPNQKMALGAVYWQYFEDIDKIKSNKKIPLIITKKYFKELANNKLQPLTNESPLKVGERVKIRMVVTLDRTMQYLMLKDSRASTFEPIDVLSGYHYSRATSYYKSTKDTATYFFFDQLQKGSYTIEYSVYVTHKGEFLDGIATIESMYAPEFKGHTVSESKIIVQ